MPRLGGFTGGVSRGDTGGESVASSKWEKFGGTFTRKTIEKWWFNGGLMGFYGILWDLPSGDVKIAMENGHRHSGFAHGKW